MSPREALSEAERVATIAEKRCKAVLTFQRTAGQRCEAPCVRDSPFCWTHTHAAENPSRRAPVLMFPAYVGAAR